MSLDICNEAYTVAAAADEEVGRVDIAAIEAHVVRAVAAVGSR